jgi:hypothetical protein
MDLNNPYASPVGDGPHEPGTWPPQLPPDAALVDEVSLPPDAVQVEFHALREDYLHFMEYWKSRHGVPWYARLRSFLMLIAVVGFIILGCLLLDNWAIAGPIVGAAVMFLVLVIGLWQLASWGHTKYPAGANFEQRDAALIYWQRITLVPDYYIYSSGVEQSLLRWRRFAEVLQTEHAIYLIEHQHLTHFVPRRAFASTADFARFAETAQRFQQQANPVAEQDQDSAQPPTPATQ